MKHYFVAEINIQLVQRPRLWFGQARILNWIQNEILKTFLHVAMQEIHFRRFDFFLFYFFTRLLYILKWFLKVLLSSDMMGSYAMEINAHRFC